ncbi:MAG: hypothetical protein CBE05_002145 [Candidatus Puniceispirillum sp. TMED245]|nr:MAG: hypothetical protein CBE05_002145 [Candidatus Puniceispirillum sp. TMED245]
MPDVGPAVTGHSPSSARTERIRRYNEERADATRGASERALAKGRWQKGVGERALAKGRWQTVLYRRGATFRSSDSGQNWI